MRFRLASRSMSLDDLELLFKFKFSRTFVLLRIFGRRKNCCLLLTVWLWRMQVRGDLVTALYDILYKRLRNTLTYLLTYLLCPTNHMAVERLPWR